MNQEGSITERMALVLLVLLLKSHCDGHAEKLSVGLAEGRKSISPNASYSMVSLTAQNWEHHLEQKERQKFP